MAVRTMGSANAVIDVNTFITATNFSTTSSFYIAGQAGFNSLQFDYEAAVFTSSADLNIFEIFDMSPPDYDVISSSIGILDTYDDGTLATFQYTLPIFESASFTDDNNVDSSNGAFIATSADYSGFTASIDVVDNIEEAGPFANYNPDQPAWPDPPPVGTIDLNRFRKTYSHVRVRPKFRKYTT